MGRAGVPAFASGKRASRIDELLLKGGAASATDGQPAAQPMP
jgi:hypothetical protein